MRELSPGHLDRRCEEYDRFTFMTVETDRIVWSWSFTAYSAGIVRSVTRYWLCSLSLTLAGQWPPRPGYFAQTISMFVFAEIEICIKERPDSTRAKDYLSKRTVPNTQSPCTALLTVRKNGRLDKNTLFHFNFQRDGETNVLNIFLLNDKARGCVNLPSIKCSIKSRASWAWPCYQWGGN